VDISLYFVENGSRRYGSQVKMDHKSLKMDHVMQVVVRTVNFVRTRGLNHRQLTVFSVIRRFFIHVGKLKTLCANNHFQIS